MSESSKRSLGYWSVVAIGVGGMVGGGIFAVLGLAVQLAHGGTPVAFALAGLVRCLPATPMPGSRWRIRAPAARSSS